MFFPELIKSIKTGDRVLEIGPGATPHPRADVLLEKRFHDPGEQSEQRGNTPELRTDKTVVYYDGGVFPFRDNEFDYTICSHVLEHVEDPETFMGEVFRVSRRGYVEFPTAYYEYLYNFRVHINFLKKTGDTLYYLPKSQTPLDLFQPVQRLLLESLNKGYSDLVDDLRGIMFEGFEWSAPFDIQRAVSLEQVSFGDLTLPQRPPRSCSFRPLRIITSLLQRRRP